jgi:ATP phosphoribosyltransferase regulatory subunit
VESTSREGIVEIDLSEVGVQAYYTGVVFQAYCEGIGSSIASGGRYDTLLDSFGVKVPSIGFSFQLRKVETIVGRPERFAVPAVETVEGVSFVDKVRKAETLRKNGKIAVV